MIFYAFRYALGRMTYAVYDVTSHIIQHKHELHEDTKNRMCKEIRHAIRTGNAGMSDHVREWEKVLGVLSE
jgi:hypothetical protein